MIFEVGFFSVFGFYFLCIIMIALLFYFLILEFFDSFELFPIIATFKYGIPSILCFLSILFVIYLSFLDGFKSNDLTFENISGNSFEIVSEEKVIDNDGEEKIKTKYFLKVNSNIDSVEFVKKEKKKEKNKFKISIDYDTTFEIDSSKIYNIRIYKGSKQVRSIEVAK